MIIAHLKRYIRPPLLAPSAAASGNSFRLALTVSFQSLFLWSEPLCVTLSFLICFMDLISISLISKHAVNHLVDIILLLQKFLSALISFAVLLLAILCCGIAKESRTIVVNAKGLSFSLF